MNSSDYPYEHVVEIPSDESSLESVEEEETNVRVEPHMQLGCIKVNESRRDSINHFLFWFVMLALAGACVGAIMYLILRS